jgi:hypothetical protein
MGCLSGSKGGMRSGSTCITSTDGLGKHVQRGKSEGLVGLVVHGMGGLRPEM